MIARVGEHFALLLLVAAGCRSTADASLAPEGPAAPSWEAGADWEGAQRVFIANHGKLAGSMSGFAWVAGGEGTRFRLPNPCDETSCFKGTDSTLCTQGTIPALQCAAGVCNWESDWGAKIGLDVNRVAAPWGANAPAELAIHYAGSPTPVRLTAHRAGDPPAKEYCVERYRSGDRVSAARFVTRCWAEPGEPLSDFASVDKIGLQIPSADHFVSFEQCVTSIWTLPRPAR